MADKGSNLNIIPIPDVLTPEQKLFNKVNMWRYHMGLLDTMKIKGVNDIMIHLFAWEAHIKKDYKK